MYEPLVSNPCYRADLGCEARSDNHCSQKRIFRFIENFGHENSHVPKRRFEENRSLQSDPPKHPSGEPHTAAFPLVMSDFDLSQFKALE